MRKLISLFIALTLGIGAWAQETQSVSYIDANGQQQMVTATVVTNETGTLNAGWYVVTGEVSRGNITCNGAVHLILADGAKLTANGWWSVPGITVSDEGNSLTIYGQTNQSGQLIANGGKYAAGIGGGNEQSGHDITINGGTVTATGGEDGTGIGGGRKGSGSNITINGGTVTATGGASSAGIGGGWSGSGSNITVNGGKVTASGGSTEDGLFVGDCIGSGTNSNPGSNIFVAVDLIVRAGNDNPPATVVATGRTAETDIAGVLVGKRHATVRIPQGGIVTYGEHITVSPQFASGSRINSETEVTFTAADRWNDYYEFIGFYKESTFENKITQGVSGQTYTVRVLDDDISVFAKYEKFPPVFYVDADGQEKFAKPTEITNETSTLNAGWYVVTGTDMQTGTLVCSGDVHLILVDGAKLTATGNNDSHTPGIQVSGNGNSLTIYGQTAQSGQLIANGGLYAAGIGGGQKHANSAIIINGGIVTANGGDWSSGIGGGFEGAGYNIVINGGTVTATSGRESAGIGGGQHANGYDITINGGEVTANGGENAAGIGRGNGGTGSNIKVATAFTVYADNTNPPTTEISHTDNDIAPYIATLRYVVVNNDKTDAKSDAIAAINAAVEGITNTDIIAIATNAKTAINAATSTETINALKEQALADIASAKAACKSVLGELGTEKSGTAVKVTKDEKEVILYAPNKVEYIIKK